MLPSQCPRFSGSLVFQQENRSKRLNSRSIAINLLSWLLEQQNSRIHWPIHYKSNAKFLNSAYRYSNFIPAGPLDLQDWWKKYTSAAVTAKHIRGRVWLGPSPISRVSHWPGETHCFSMMKFPVQHSTLYQKYKKFWTFRHIQTFPNPSPADILVHTAFKSFKRSVSPGLKQVANWRCTPILGRKSENFFVFALL